MQHPDSPSLDGSNGHSHFDEPITTTKGPDSPLPAIPPIEGTTELPATEAAPVGEKALPPAVSKAVDDVIYSEIGITTLLGRLKQSIASARELANFFKNLAKAEDIKANALRHLAKGAHRDRNETRGGSYAAQFEQVAAMQERIANNGVQFSLNLTQMHDDLLNMATDKDRERKHWKTTGLSAEERVQDAERTMDKAKSKYDSLAEDYDRERTGDSSGRHFGLRSIGKSGDQRQEDLHRRVKAADEDYQAKVQNAQVSRQELLSTLRPQAIHALQQLIEEVDSGVVMQMQKFAGYSEQTVLRNGLLLSPGTDGAPGQKSLRDVIGQIDNESDLRNYILSNSGRVGPKPAEIRYEQHPTLRPAVQPVMAPSAPSNLAPAVGRPQQQGPPQIDHAPPSSAPFAMQHSTMAMPTGSSLGSPPLGQQRQGGGVSSLPPQNFGRYDGGFSGPGGPDRLPQGPPAPPYPTDNNTIHSNTRGASGPAPYGSDISPPQHFSPTMAQHPPPSNNNYNLGPSSGVSSVPSGGMGMNGGGPLGRGQPPSNMAAIPPTTQPGVGLGAPRPSTRDGSTAGGPRRMFNLSLDELFNRDKTPVPLLVIQCIQAVDSFGLDAEGIYRVSGNQNHVNALKAAFDNDAYRVDFRNPESFYHDVHVPANLLKLFFRELPDPLFTRERYDDFMRAAQIEDDVARRDSLHAIINDMPDANYATLRALILHLHRIDTHSATNRMTPQNLAVIFGPTLLGPHSGPDMALAGLQPKVIWTILTSALQIFDED